MAQVAHWFAQMAYRIHFAFFTWPYIVRKFFSSYVMPIYPNVPALA